VNVCNKALLIWITALAILMFLPIHAVYGIDFPITNPSTGVPMQQGMCMEGVQILAGYYPSSNIQYAYNPGNPGHTWLFVDGQPIDYYYGPQQRTYQWMFPTYTFNTYAELQNAI
jgi:hypothetical protein